MISDSNKWNATITKYEPGSEPQLIDCWKNLLAAEFKTPSMQSLRAFLKSELAAGKTIFPKGGEMFNALNLTPFETVKVVLIGQDPYHGPNQAHGLCFSVRPGQAIPRSLQNIYKELEQDLGIKPASHGHLINWAQQGVLMLNSVLSVEKGLAGSHRGKGWEQFTDRIVQICNQNKKGLVYLLWGKDAQQKCIQVDAKNNLVLKAAHPSPFSAHMFFGCRHFSRTNEYLKGQGLSPINW